MVLPAWSGSWRVLRHRKICFYVCEFYVIGKLENEKYNYVNKHINIQYVLIDIQLYSICPESLWEEVVTVPRGPVESGPMWYAQARLHNDRIRNYMLNQSVPARDQKGGHFPHKCQGRRPMDIGSQFWNVPENYVTKSCLIGHSHIYFCFYAIRHDLIWYDDT